MLFGFKRPVTSRTVPCLNIDNTSLQNSAVLDILYAM